MTKKELILTTADCRALGFCARGQRQFFKANGMDYLTFFKNGMPFSAFDGVDDLNLKAAMQHAKDRIQNEQG